MSGLGRDRESAGTLPSLSTLTRSEYTGNTDDQSGMTRENNAAFDLGRTPSMVSSLTMSTFESGRKGIGREETLQQQQMKSNTLRNSSQFARGSMGQRQSQGQREDPHPRSLESNEERKARIMHNRNHHLTWLPIAVSSSSDLVWGSWWYVAGSVLSMVIPVFPLISLVHTHWWPASGATSDTVAVPTLPLNQHVWVYVLMIWLGFWYTVASLAFLRAVRVPKPPPLFSWYHIQSDELFGIWSLLLANIVTLPITLIYAVYYGTSTAVGQEMLFAFICVSLFAVLNAIAVYSCYPDGIMEAEFNDREVPKQYLAPLLARWYPYCLPTSWKKHLSNDWLIVSWAMVWGCLACCVFSLTMVWHVQARTSSDTALTSRETFDYATAAVDMFMFTVGSLYFAAGSYNQGNSRIKDTVIYDSNPNRSSNQLHANSDANAGNHNSNSNSNINADNDIRTPLAQSQKLYESTGTIEEPLV